MPDGMLDGMLDGTVDVKWLVCKTDLGGKLEFWRIQIKDS
jgi:hypothetical protein